jgi:hypothetical protein
MKSRAGSLLMFDAVSRDTVCHDLPAASNPVDRAPSEMKPASWLWQPSEHDSTQVYVLAQPASLRLPVGGGVRTCGCPIPGLPAETCGFTSTRAMIRLVTLRLTYLVIRKLLSRIVLLRGAESAKGSRYSYSATNSPCSTGHSTTPAVAAGPGTHRRPLAHRRGFSLAIPFPY